MYSCLVCSNKYYKTRFNRPEVIYHRFPKDAKMRRKWLRVLEIESCEEWHRICSEHFLKENYKPGKRRFLFPKVCPQPYDQNKTPNDATQINDVETGNNIILPTEQNITRNLAYYDESHCIESEFYREENFGNAVVNNFKSPKRSSRLNRNNEDTRSENADIINTKNIPSTSSGVNRWIFHSNEKVHLMPINEDSSNSSLPITLEPIEERIFKISEEVVLPNLYWKCEHNKTQNATRFCQQDSNDITVKKIIFFNNLVPSIEIYGKNYEFKTPITTKEELEDLLEKIDDIIKCHGRGGFVFDQCLGYIENSSDIMCSGCQGLVTDQDLERMKAKKEAYNQTVESFKKRIAERKEIVLNLRKALKESK